MAKGSKKNGKPIDALKRFNPDDVVVLSSGVKARLKPVAATLIADVATRIPEPEIPKVFIEEKGREEENPSDPGYLRKMNETNIARSRAIMDTIVMLGVELVDGVPPNDQWLPKLMYLVKLGHFVLEGYDLDDQFDREFIFKRYIAVGAFDMADVMSRSGITEEEIAHAGALFRG